MLTIARGNCALSATCLRTRRRGSDARVARRLKTRMHAMPSGAETRSPVVPCAAQGVCVRVLRAFGRGKAKKRQREPELPVALFVVCGCKSIALRSRACSTALGVSKKNVPDAAPKTCHAECCVLGCTQSSKTAAMAARAVLREEQRTRFAAMRHVASERR
ncbi:hypothetical protein ERJ75_000613400 [Trypanosoma vivax]|nr:hypothetical protein ERJ75_000613400 [Trypanosoma vivax]